MREGPGGEQELQHPRQSAGLQEEEEETRVPRWGCLSEKAMLDRAKTRFRLFFCFILDHFNYFGHMAKAGCGDRSFDVSLQHSSSSPGGEQALQLPQQSAGPDV